MTRFAALIAALALFGTAAPVRAQEPPTVARRDPGTHGILQATAGLTLDGGATPTYGIIFGAGGRAPHSPLRLYLFFEAARGRLDSAGASTAGSWAARLDRTEVAPGLRFLIPVSGPLRLYADVLIGGTVYAATLDREGLGPRSTEDTSVLVDLAAGMDLRLYRNLSVGVRLKGHLVDPTPSWIEAQHISLCRRTDVSAAVTLHFSEPKPDPEPEPEPEPDPRANVWLELDSGPLAWQAKTSTPNAARTSTTM